MATFAEAPGAEEFEAQGVPADEAPQVALLAETLAEDFARYGAEALRDASTLLRFLRAREGKVSDAAAMWRDTHAWRRLHIPAALGEIGAFGDARAPLDAQRSDWTWAMFRDPTRCASARAALALKHGHAIRAPTLDPWIADAALPEGAPNVTVSVVEGSSDDSVLSGVDGAETEADDALREWTSRRAEQSLPSAETLSLFQRIRCGQDLSHSDSWLAP